MDKEPNIALTGDEARALMMALATSSGQLPASVVINLWSRLNELSQVQPPQQQQKSN